MPCWRPLVSTFVLLAMGALAPAAAQGATAALAPDAAEPAAVIVCVPKAGDRAELEDFLVLAGGRVLDELPALALLQVELPDPGGTAAAAGRLAALGGVAFAEPDGWGEGGGFVVDDTFFEVQWHLDNRGEDGGTIGADIEAVRGWELARGSPGVRVAVLDSGLTLAHPEFAGRVLPGHDFVNDDEVPADDHGHGTWVTSILACNADNAFGLAGVDHQCLLIPVKVLNRNNAGSTFDLAQGLVFAADAGADVISMSLIDYPASAAVREALQYARAAGCVLVACAGNGGIGDADRSFPGRSLLTISVGATTRQDRRASFSGTGDRLDLVAPGEDVPVMLRAPFDGWGYFSGCSAATPVAAGIAAVALSLAPTLSHEEVQVLLESGAEDEVGPPLTDPPGRDDQYGHGRVNLFRTLCALDAGGPMIVAPDVLPIECPTPGGLAGDDPLVTAALDAVVASDDLDPEPVLAHGPLPAWLALGQTVPVEFTATDRCGNESRRELTLTVVDTRPPELALTLLFTRLEAPDGRLRPVGLRALAADACDIGPELALRVYGDEPAAMRREQDALLGASDDLLLRAERDSAGDGRVYLCVVTARDDSGNAATRCATVVVANGTSPEALAGVLAQATAAREECERTGNAPAGFTLLLAAMLAKSPSVSAPR